MSRFDNIAGEWFWFPTPAKGYPIARDGALGLNKDIINYPGFGELIGEETAELKHYMFGLVIIHTPRQEDYKLCLKYSNGVFSAKLVIDMSSGRKDVFVMSSLGEDQSLTEFKSDNKQYCDMCDRIHAAEKQAAEVESLRAENAALRAEIEHLRYRPGGPGYDEAAEHFAELVTE